VQSPLGHEIRRLVNGNNGGSSPGLPVDDADHIHDAALTELVDSCLERGVAEVAVAVHLGAEVIERRLVVLQAFRPGAGAETDENLPIKAGLDGQGMVRAPLVELGSLAGGDHDRKFAQSGRQRAVEANKIADMKEQYAKRGAARA
jgi:hypothetical protein